MLNRHTMTNPYLTATVKAEGAELCSLCDARGAEMLWQAQPIWPRHAPVLFPIVGRLTQDQLWHRGKVYRMTQHGFARDRRFAWLSRTPAACRLVLHDDAETRALYPFAFRLEVAFALDDDTLEQSFTVANPGRDVLPASLGAHPAFVWPLAERVAKPAHALAFALAETAPVRRLTDGLLAPAPAANPIEGNMLRLDPMLFAADALILDRVASHAVRFAAPGTEAIEVSWQGFTALGLWSRMTGEGTCADFLCIEPWHGIASPVGFDGAFRDKPGLMLIPPGETRTLTMRIRLC